MTTLDVLDRTRHYILENFLYARPDVRLADDEHLFEREIVDSLGTVELVHFLQDEFGIEIGDDEVTEQHFSTLRSIAEFVCDKRAATTATLQ
jgi:acyl carrier protein